jgi:hypothetical protein
MASAERELCAFMRAVSEMFGAEHARRAADDWLDEFERMDTLPETRNHFGSVTIAAAMRLATSLKNDRESGSLSAGHGGGSEGEPVGKFNRQGGYEKPQRVATTFTDDRVKIVVGVAVADITPVTANTI